MSIQGIFMKRKGFVLVPFLMVGFFLLTCGAHADVGYSWTKTFGGFDSDRGRAVSVDSSGNAYVTGEFQDVADLDPGAGTDERTSAGETDIFVSKISATGEYLWSFAFGDSGSDSGEKIAIDASGDMYVAGRFRGTIDFDPGLGTQDRTCADWCVFIAKYTPDGDFLWVRKGEMYTASVEDIAVDTSGSIVMAGSMGYYAYFELADDAESYMPSYYAVKYDSAGNFVWIKAPETGEGLWATAMTMDSSSGVYVAGKTDDLLIDFDPDPIGTDTIFFDHQDNFFLTKYSASGEYQFTKTMSSTADCDAPQANAMGHSPVNGGVYLTGEFYCEWDFDPSGDEDLHSPVNGFFLARFASNGDYSWTTVQGVGQRWGEEMDFDPLGNIFVLGSKEGALAGLDEYAPGGFHRKGLIIGEDTYRDSFNSIAIDPVGNIYITGLFYHESMDFNPWAAHDMHSSIGSNDAFLSKFGSMDEFSGGGGGSNGDGSQYAYHYFSTNLDINSTISIGCDTSVSMNALVGTGRSTINDNNQADCTVITNNASGYKMEWQASTDDMYNSQNDSFAAYAPFDPSIPEEWTVSSTSSAWGAKLSATSEGYNGGAGGNGYTFPGTGWGTDDTYSGGMWLNVASSPFQIMSKSFKTDVNGETQSIVFAAEIGADKLQPTGTYTQEVTVTATTL